MRGQSPAVENLDIEFSRGEFVFLVGASGSGKSTLMRMILKEVTPTRGVVYVAGKDLSRIPSWRVPSLRRDIGMVFQDFRLLPSKTAYQNIELALAVIGTPPRSSGAWAPGFPGWGAPGARAAPLPLRSPAVGRRALPSAAPSPTGPR